MILLGLLLSLGLTSFAGNLSIYGDDNRVDVFTVANPLYKKLASASAALIERTNLRVQGPVTQIQARSLGDMYKLCPGERFRAQPTAASCSGTLIAPDLILTAAHCYEHAKETCKNSVWVFDYKVEKENQGAVRTFTSNVYECQSVLLKEMDLAQEFDHALIRLTRPVLDRQFARLRSQGSVKPGDPLVLIGHPSGLPTKLAGDGYVLKVTPNAFTSNVDAFTINSGSGVFSAVTGELEGILASGRSDYDGKGNCTSVKNYAMSEGNEKVSKPYRVKQFLER